MSPSDNVPPLRSALRLAKASLHRDMFVASSPASSIESRMHLEQDSPYSASQDTSQSIHTRHHQKTTCWRYSTAPENLATPYHDVREPLPSPTLPDPLPLLDLINEECGGTEPASSGFTSPYLIAGQAVSSRYAAGIALPSSLPDTPGEDEYLASRLHGSKVICSTPLEKSMEELHVSGSTGISDQVDDSPIVNHLRRKSAGGSSVLPQSSSPERIIYLSESAEAAAESAKAKRKLLKDTFKIDHDQMVDEMPDAEAYSHNPRCRSDLNVEDFQQMRQKRRSLTPCPDPSAHLMQFSRLERPISVTDTDMLMTDHSLTHGQMYPTLVMPRTTATGSPMPFPRMRPRPPTAQSDPYAGSIDPIGYFPPVHIVHDHFSPAWPQRPGRPSVQPTYSFSTAASKVHGSNQAPDYRIRDSYKTDTLTALARPPNRYRRNGIGADIVPRGVSRYYQRPPSSMRPSSAKSRPSSRRTYNGDNEVHFRSSPPKAPGPQPFIPLSRKRAIDDSFLVADGQVHAKHWNTRGSAPQSEEIIQLDDETSAAVRMSIFGTNTPEALHHARQGLRELSPNVQLYRKSKQENVHLRKKRRPSYWDNDLKEIRESPAGRGGVNSPVSAQASMRAEFEIASLRNTEMDFENDEDAPRSTQVQEDLRSRLS